MKRKTLEVLIYSIRGLYMASLDCNYPSLWKENKANSGTEDNAKSGEVGTREVGQQSDLSRGQSSTQGGKF